MTSAVKISVPSARAEPREAGDTRLFPVGAEVQQRGVHFRVWAPRSSRLAVVLADDVEMKNARSFSLVTEANGYFSGLLHEARAGQHYRFALDHGEFPDPASRFQPAGPHGPSRIVDPRSFPWSNSTAKGVRREGHVIYEMHIGTFSAEGTWAAAIERLPALAELGVTMLEVMPIADFPGRFGWGYDGVNLFAPTRLYGEPDDFRRFVDHAHRLGLAVILDVVYNHIGPDGNYLREFSKDYFSSKYDNEWGDAINFDDKNNGGVREFFVSNAAYWISEFRLDGLRLDATQQIFDASKEHIVTAISRASREAAGKRGIYIVAENEPQHTRLVRPPDQGGYGLDALWNDDFHHSAMVAMTGNNEAYYTDHRGWPQEFISAAKWGFLFQGQRYSWQKARRGRPALDVEPAQFVNCIQNHDQIANSSSGRRIHEQTNPGMLRAMTALLLLNPATPMLFQGQEFAASSPFLYFADHNPELARMVGEGRQKFISQFPSAAATIATGAFDAPESEETFARCKLQWDEREQHRNIYELHRDLIRLRREDPVIAQLRREDVHGAVLTQHAFLLRYFDRNTNADRLLLINLGPRIRYCPAPEPLLAPPEDRDWELAWSSEELNYGGGGTAPIQWQEENWILPAHSALLFIAQPTTHANAPGPEN